MGSFPSVPSLGSYGNGMGSIPSAALRSHGSAAQEVGVPCRPSAHNMGGLPPRGWVVSIPSAALRSHGRPAAQGVGGFDTLCRPPLVWEAYRPGVVGSIPSAAQRVVGSIPSAPPLFVRALPDPIFYIRTTLRVL